MFWLSGKRGGSGIKIMKTKTMLHILRNPFGHSDNRKKQARLKAADEIERWKDTYENLEDWAVKNGLDVTTYNR